jgi:hypothetical protein
MARLKAAPFSEQLQIDPAPRKEKGKRGDERRQISDEEEKYLLPAS